MVEEVLKKVGATKNGASSTVPYGKEDQAIGAVVDELVIPAIDAICNPVKEPKATCLVRATTEILEKLEPVITGASEFKSVKENDKNYAAQVDLLAKRYEANNALLRPDSNTKTTKSLRISWAFAGDVRYAQAAGNTKDAKMGKSVTHPFRVCDVTDALLLACGADGLGLVESCNINDPKNESREAAKNAGLAFTGVKVLCGYDPAENASNFYKGMVVKWSCGQPDTPRFTRIAHNQAARLSCGTSP